MCMIGSITVWQSLAVIQPERADACATAFVDVQIGKNLLRFLRIFSQHKLQVMSQCGLNGGNMLISDANPIGQRSEH